MSQIAGRTLSSEFRFWVTKMLCVSASLRGSGAQRSADLLGRIDDSWPDAMDPCDPRFDKQEIALHVFCPGPEEDDKRPIWRSWEEEGLRPIGYVRVTQFVSRITSGEGSFPPIDCNVWLSAEQFSAVDAFLAKGVEGTWAEAAFALSEIDLLNGRSSSLSRRYLRDLDVNSEKTFPVIGFDLQWTDGRL